MPGVLITGANGFVGSACLEVASAFDLSITKPAWALGYQFDIVLRGPAATPVER